MYVYIVAKAYRIDKPAGTLYTALYIHSSINKNSIFKRKIIFEHIQFSFFELVKGSRKGHGYTFYGRPCVSKDQIFKAKQLQPDCWEGREGRSREEVLDKNWFANGLMDGSKDVLRRLVDWLYCHLMTVRLMHSHFSFHFYYRKFVYENNNMCLTAKILFFHLKIQRMLIVQNKKGT